MCIKLRCSNIRMPQHILNSSKVSTARQKMGSKTMPKGMRANFPFSPDFKAYFLTCFQIMIRFNGLPALLTKTILVLA